MLAMRFLTSAAAQQIDRDLMSEAGGFSIDQLMELAGLSCAEAVFHSYPPAQHKRILVACGPGNQGGDGLVAARHLHHFGYSPTIWYPKAKQAPLFDGLVQQLRNLSVPFIDTNAFETQVSKETDVVLDSIFGFSFHGEPREPFRSALEAMIRAQKAQRAVPIVSVDIPSSWNVDEGPSTSELASSFQPNVLVSLTAPKMGVASFAGEKHWLGGRFVDPKVSAKYDLQLPAYPNTSQVVDITGAKPLDV